MGESRIELLAWLNDLLQLSYTKIEQCGTGAAACGIIDSIYLDVPLTKVKFSAKHEYEYVSNWKVLQESFKRHKVDKVVPVERLAKCKMMENLEFLQWLKRFWDLCAKRRNLTLKESAAKLTGTFLETNMMRALARRRGAQVEPNPLITGVGSAHAPPSRVAAHSTAASAAPRTGSAGAKRAPAASNNMHTPSSASASAGPRLGIANNVAVDRLTAELNDMKINVEGLEKERNFYFEKLRNIEILVGARLEAEEPPSGEEEAVLKEIQAVLYQTEPGFEIPDVEGEEGALADEEETF